MKSVLYHHVHFEQLKSSVLRTAGIKSIVTSECYSLSLKVTTATGKRISETTLKRIYGFTSSSYKPSSYTLNTLSEYIGFTDWFSFCEHVDEQNSLAEGDTLSWTRVRSIAMKTSLFHLQGNQYKSGIPYELTIDRASLGGFLDGFLASDATACIVDGAAGSGKTVAITRWASERLEASRDDIILFVNSLSMQQHVMAGYDGVRWLSQLMELTSPRLLEEVVEKYTYTAPGKFYFIVDETHRTFNTYPPNQQLFSELISLVSYFSRYPWFRVILVCRSTTLKQYRKYFYNLITKPEWYSKLADGSGGLSGQPVIGMFNDVEMRVLLNRVSRLPEERLLFVPRQLELIHSPVLFQYYYKQEKGKINLADAHWLHSYKILSEYIEKTVDSTSARTDTQLLLDDIVTQVERYGEEYLIMKKEVFQVVDSYSTAYFGLLNNGLLSEVTRTVGGQPQSAIRFQSDRVLAYFLALRELANMDRPAGFFHYHPSLDTDLQRTVLKWCLFLMVKAGDMQLLNHFERYWVDCAEREVYIRFAVDAYCSVWGDKDELAEAVPDELVRLAVRTLSLSVEYHETAARLLAFDLTPSDQVALRTSLALYGLLTWNEELFMDHLKELTWIDEDGGEEDGVLNPHEAFVALYHQAVGQPAPFGHPKKLSLLWDKAAQAVDTHAHPSLYLLLYLVAHGLADGAFLDQNVVMLKRRLRHDEELVGSYHYTILQLLLGLNLVERGAVEEAASILADVPGDFIGDSVVRLLAGLLGVYVARQQGNPDQKAEEGLLAWAGKQELGLVMRLFHPTAPSHSHV